MAIAGRSAWCASVRWPPVESWTPLSSTTCTRFRGWHAPTAVSVPSRIRAAASPSITTTDLEVLSAAPSPTAAADPIAPTR